MLVVARNLSGYQWLLELSDATVFFYGPLLWWYALSFTQVNFRFSPAYWGHGFPFIMALVILEVMALGEEQVPDTLRNTLLVLKMLSVLLYLLLILSTLATYRKQLKTFFSATEQIQLDWMYFLCWTILLVWGIAVISLSLFFFFQIDIPHHGGFYSNISVSLCVFVLGWYGFRQTQVFTPAHLFKELIVAPSELAEEEENHSESKYRNSGLQKEEASQIHTQVLSFMLTHRPYLDQELSLFKLAEELTLSPNHLSQVINSLQGQNFYDFVNQYRVEEVKQLMAGPKIAQMTLLGLAMEAGFKSKASFNRAFKKFTNMTPSEYKQELS